MNLAMAAHICIFEDKHYSRLLPLAYFRPVYDLRCGIFSLREKIIRKYPRAAVTIHCRAYLADHIRSANLHLHVNEIPARECLFINGRAFVDGSFAEKISLKDHNDIVYVRGDHIVAARLSGANLERMQKQLSGLLEISHFDGLPRVEVEVEMISYPWDLVQRNGAQIRQDFDWIERKTRGKKIRGKLSKGVYLVAQDNIMIGEGSTVKPGTVLDGEEGPVYIGKNVNIFPQATIIGPAFVGDNSWIKVGAQIYENTSIGPVCKVGGEVEASIIHGYSNKQHAGFLGHSYIGSWVNLGADTNNSDLKNNYGTVKVSLGSEVIDTGLQFVGLTMGDHSKSAVNSMFNTGTVVGVCSNIFGSGFPPKYIPSFSWGAAGETFTTYATEKAIDVARRVMARRKIEMTAIEEKIFREIFNLTREYRKRCGLPD